MGGERSDGKEVRSDMHFSGETAHVNINSHAQTSAFISALDLSRPIAPPRNMNARARAI